ncbi:MAG TPA: MarR family transcriptional regulator [Methylovirgula sp.]|nr:MarR family transcriptional regulator [Methylovirgula sp.]
MKSSKTRQDLIAALNTAMREASGQGVLYSQAVAQRLGINSTDLECLDHIALRGPLTAGALAAATGLTSGAITGVIDRLERAGFAARERDANDRRKVLVRALPAIEKKIAPLFEPMQKAAIASLSSYSDKELALLLDFLQRARDASLAAMAELGSLPA